MGDEIYLKVEWGVSFPMDFGITTFDGRGVHENAMLNTHPQRPLTN